MRHKVNYMFFINVGIFIVLEALGFKFAPKYHAASWTNVAGVGASSLTVFLIVLLSSIHTVFLSVITAYSCHNHFRAWQTFATRGLCSNLLLKNFLIWGTYNIYLYVHGYQASSPFPSFHRGYRLKNLCLLRLCVLTILLLLHIYQQRGNCGVLQFFISSFSWLGMLMIIVFHRFFNFVGGFFLIYSFVGLFGGYVV